MSKTWKIVLSFMLVLAVGLVSFSMVAAQDDTTAPQPPFGRMGRMGGRGFGGFGPGMGGPDNSLVAVAADELGLEWADLIAELQAGKSVADIAEEQGIELETIVEAFVAPRAENLEALVEAGTLTQDEADSRLALMTAHVTARLSETFTPGSGYGHGPGAGGQNGPCGANAGFGPRSGRPAGRMGGRWS